MSAILTFADFSKSVPPPRLTAQSLLPPNVLIILRYDTHQMFLLLRVIISKNNYGVQITEKSEKR